jgi:NADPH2:quinone reductase
MLAKHFGAKVIVTAGSPEKCDACRKLGADVAIDYNKEDFVVATKQATGNKGADLILDMVGGDYVDRNFEAAAVEGRIVQIATQKGAKVNIDLRRLMLKRLTHTGSTLRARPVSDKAAIARALEAGVWSILESGKLRPVIDSTFPLARAADAHARMETSAHIGKIVLEVSA